MKTQEAIAVLARLMIEHKIHEGGEVHLAYTRAVNAIRSFESALRGHLQAKADREVGAAK